MNKILLIVITNVILLVAGIEKNDFYVLYEITDIQKILPKKGHHCFTSIISSGYLEVGV